MADWSGSPGVYLVSASPALLCVWLLMWGLWMKSRPHACTVSILPTVLSFQSISSVFIPYLCSIIAAFSLWFVNKIVFKAEDFQGKKTYLLIQEWEKIDLGCVLGMITHTCNHWPWKHKAGWLSELKVNLGLHSSRLTWTIEGYFPYL